MNWELSQRSKSCRLCQKPFAHGDRIFTALYRAGNASLPEIFANGDNLKEEPADKNPLMEEGIRIDLCPDCFEREKESLKHDFNWLGRLQVREEIEKPGKKLDLSRESLLEELKNLLDQTRVWNAEDEHLLTRRGVAYLLAVMLERKRWLVHAGDALSESDGTRMALYEVPKTDETLQVPYPLLSTEWIWKYQAALAALMRWPVVSRET